MHDTKEVDQLAVIRGLLERQATRSEALDAKVDALRAEGSARGLEQAAFNKRFEADLGSVRNEVHRLSNRVQAVETGLAVVQDDIRDLEDADHTLTRLKSETDLETEAAIGGAIAHVSRLDEALRSLSENDDKQNVALEGLRANDERQERVNEALCDVMGIDYSALSVPSTTVENGAGVAKRPKPTTNLVGLARENKKATAGAALAFLTALVHLVLELVKH